MDTVRADIAESRADTDQSLGAERAITDTSIVETWVARRILDDLIERDRISADERLWKFRQSVDGVLARGRSSSPSAARAVDQERHEADEHTKAERKEADALLERERERSDAAIGKERQERECDRAQLEARRQDTNAQLIAERDRADLAVAALGDSKASLAHAAGEHGHERDVLAIVTHDLRSPLNVISVNAQYIARFSQEATIREAADDATRAAARMERLLIDLLDVARIDAGALRMVKLPNDAAVLVAQILHSYQPLFESRGMTFNAEAPAEGLMVPFDHDRIVQVISNLLGNAMKFSSPAGKVSLRVQRRTDALEFEVRDNGPGIHSDELAHVFEKFWKIDSDTRRGLGLGLHICKSIVEGHGGRIWVESEFGRGAAFFFTLPAP
jgi:signal transduction histidine kinase